VKISTYSIITCIAFFAFPACKKKTVTEMVPVLNSPLDTMLANITGTKQWYGRYYKDISTFAAPTDTTLSFAFTTGNNSTILCSAFGGVDTLHYESTDEFHKWILFYAINRFQGTDELIYFYSADSLRLEVDGKSSDSLWTKLEISSP